MVRSEGKMQGAETFVSLFFFLCEKMFPESWLHSEIGTQFIGQSEKSQSAREPYC